MIIHYHSKMTMSSFQWPHPSLKIGTHENTIDSPVHPMGLRDGQDKTLGLGGIRKDRNPMDRPVHPMGLWDGTGYWDLGGIRKDRTHENPMDRPVHPTGP